MFLRDFIWITLEGKAATVLAFGGSDVVLVCNISPILACIKLGRVNPGKFEVYAAPQNG